MFSLIHPEMVDAVVLGRTIPCTLPLRKGAGGDDLILPAGIGDVEAYRSEPLEENPHQNIRLGVIRAGNAARDSREICQWTGTTVFADAHLDRVTSALREIGAEVQVTTAGTGADVVSLLQSLLDEVPSPAAARS
jgi:hypothetical protein